MIKKDQLKKFEYEDFEIFAFLQTWLPPEPKEPSGVYGKMKSHFSEITRLEPYSFGNSGKWRDGHNDTISEIELDELLVNPDLIKAARDFYSSLSEFIQTTESRLNVQEKIRDHFDLKVGISNSERTDSFLSVWHHYRDIEAQDILEQILVEKDQTIVDIVASSYQVLPDEYEGKMILERIDNELYFSFSWDLSFPPEDYDPYEDDVMDKLRDEYWFIKRTVTQEFLNQIQEVIFQVKKFEAVLSN